jgi:hypothetical protein
VLWGAALVGRTPASPMDRAGGAFITHGVRQARECSGNDGRRGDVVEDVKPTPSRAHYTLYLRMGRRDTAMVSISESTKVFLCEVL